MLLHYDTSTTNIRVQRKDCELLEPRKRLRVGWIIKLSFALSKSAWLGQDTAV